MPRVNYWSVAPDLLALQRQLEHLLNNGAVEHGLLDLVRTRVSQMNQCALCLDLHWREALKQGVTEDKLRMLDVWRSTPWFTDRERAALEWAEAITNVQAGHVPDASYEQAKAAFNERELVELTYAITNINTWNRLGIAFRTVPGTPLPKVAAAPTVTAELKAATT
jgi:AhpD family alkylhydroperoxidase